MCGFAGFYTLSLKVSEQDLRRAVGVIGHRGPDAEGVCFMEKPNLCIGLGHRRLAIIDSSTGANQPFVSSCGNYVIVFNGEVYNYLELAKELNVHLKSASDTEVILELFVKFGPDFVSKLNGMFAFAIYDLVNEKMFLYRDRLGVKPLFYFWDKNNLLFASELKSLLSINSLKTKLSVNRKAVKAFLHLGYIPQPLTIFKELNKFPAGSYAVVDRGKIEFTQYWKPSDSIIEKDTRNQQEIKKELKELLESSVKYRMVSDVPFGTFLSGGVDSSLVTSIASKHSKAPLKTFSIGFEEKQFDESRYAKEVASYLKTEHHELIVSQQNALDNFELVMDNFDEPFADTSALPTYLVSQLASKHVKMVLTGDGGDELFMGYGAYRWAQRLSNPLVDIFKMPASLILSTIGNNRLKRVSEMLQTHIGSRQTHIFSQEQYLFSQKEISEILIHSNEQFDDNVSTEKFKRDLSPAETQALFDINFYLKDDLLVKVDRASMMCSLEAREPMLDYRLVEFALNIPQQFKMDKDKYKIILKDVLFDYLPESFFNRPKKGFSIPLAIWMKSELKYLIDDYLSKGSIEQVGLFKFEHVKNLISRFDKGENYLYNRLYAISVIQKWFLKNN